MRDARHRAAAGAAAAGPIVVIGSINMDLVCRCRRFPKPGETVIGSEFAAVPGGKGANQAVAAARLGAETHLVGRVGDDLFGRRLLAGLRENGVETARVRTTRGVPSGVASILVDARGQNTIAVAPGANGRVTAADVRSARSLLARAAVVILQLELPLETVECAVDLCRRLGVYTVLDPAPAPEDRLPASVLRVDLVTPNEQEARAIGPRMLGRAALVVFKQGKRGAAIASGAGGLRRRVEPFRVSVVDTTAAGDAFTAALAVALSEGRPLDRAVVFANAAGALACTRLGAQPSLPRRSAVERLVAKRWAAKRWKVNP